jgi:hypothetical protein
VIDVERGGGVAENHPGHVVDGQRAGQSRGQLAQALQPAGHLRGLGGHREHTGDRARAVAHGGVAPGEEGLLALAAGPGQRRLRLEHGPAGAENLGDRGARLLGRTAQGRRVQRAEQLGVRVVVDQQEAVAGRQGHRQR